MFSIENLFEKVDFDALSQVNYVEINVQAYISEQSTLHVIAPAINQTPCLQLVP